MEVLQMADCYSVAVLEDKKIYYLGKLNASKSMFPLLLEKIILNKNFCFYHDGGFSEDKYQDELQFEIIDINFTKEEYESLESSRITNEEFDIFYENFNGEETNFILIKQFFIKVEEAKTKICPSCNKKSIIPVFRWSAKINRILMWECEICSYDEAINL
jgi:hypothetical protein